MSYLRTLIRSDKKNKCKTSYYFACRKINCHNNQLVKKLLPIWACSRSTTDTIWACFFFFNDLISLGEARRSEKLTQNIQPVSFGSSIRLCFILIFIPKFNTQMNFLFKSIFSYLVKPQSFEDQRYRSFRKREIQRILSGDGNVVGGKSRHKHLCELFFCAKILLVRKITLLW